MYDKLLKPRQSFWITLYLYISAIGNSSTITEVFKSHLDDKVSTCFLHKSQQFPITTFQFDLYWPPFVLNAHTHPWPGHLPFQPIRVTFNRTVFPHLAIKCQAKIFMTSYKNDIRLLTPYSSPSCTRNTHSANVQCSTFCGTKKDHHRVHDSL